MGAFFIRHKLRGLLYWRVLARYVQMATQGGVIQVVFPEGGLSLDGCLALPCLVFELCHFWLVTTGLERDNRNRLDQ